MIFVDSSVWIAASQPDHVHHSASIRFAALLQTGEVATAAHTIAETYAVLTRLPPTIRFSPAMALVVVERIFSIANVICLSAEEYAATIHSAAKSAHAGGMIYDALLLACARKIDAERIYTWNLKHFRALAPDLATRIQTP